MKNFKKWRGLGSYFCVKILFLFGVEVGDDQHHVFVNIYERGRKKIFYFFGLKLLLKKIMLTVIVDGAYKEWWFLGNNPYIYLRELQIEILYIAMINKNLA